MRLYARAFQACEQFLHFVDFFLERQSIQRRHQKGQTQSTKPETSKRPARSFSDLEFRISSSAQSLTTAHKSSSAFGHDSAFLTAAGLKMGILRNCKRNASMSGGRSSG